MFESDDEIRELDDLFARTFARANPQGGGGGGGGGDRAGVEGDLQPETFPE